MTNETEVKKPTAAMFNKVRAVAVGTGKDEKGLPIRRDANGRKADKDQTEVREPVEFRLSDMHRDVVEWIIQAGLRRFVSEVFNNVATDDLAKLRAVKDAADRMHRGELLEELSGKRVARPKTGLDPVTEFAVNAWITETLRKLSLSYEGPGTGKNGGITQPDLWAAALRDNPTIRDNKLVREVSTIGAMPDKPAIGAWLHKERPERIKAAEEELGKVKAAPNIAALEV